MLINYHLQVVHRNDVPSTMDFVEMFEGFPAKSMTQMGGVDESNALDRNMTIEVHATSTTYHPTS